jgi:hypothetical protein
MNDFLDAITIADRLVLPCFGSDHADSAASNATTAARARTIEVEIVAVANRDGTTCLVDAFFNPIRYNGRTFGTVLGDATFLRALKAALAERGFPADSLAYLEEQAQDEHCIALESGADLAQAVLAHIAAEQVGAVEAA